MRQFSFRGKREKEERERKQGKQAEEVCGEQTEDNGVWVSGGVFGVIGPERQSERERERERETEWVKGPEQRKVDHHCH